MKYLYSLVWSGMFLFGLALDHFTGKGKICLADMTYTELWIGVFFALAPTVFMADELRIKRKCK